MKNNITWHKIADSEAEINVAANGLAQITVAGKSVCLAKKNGVINACATKCPHAGGIMTNGFIDALGNIVCPLHRYKFSLQNGRNVSGEGYFLKLFPVEIRPEGVFIGLEENKLFNWLK
jgi:3-phenylpropionate/trans-cinnamate dioxygenase ferredoxin subunit